MKEKLIRATIITYIAMTAVMAIDRIEKPEAKEIVKIEAAQEEIEIELVPIKEPAPELKSFNGITEGDTIIGELTHYDVCIACCGKTNGETASGLIIKNGIEPEIPVASCNWLPLGSIVEINGIKHIIADTGGPVLDKVGRLDIFTPAGHQAALNLGRIKGAEIKIISLGGTENEKGL